MCRFLLFKSQTPTNLQKILKAFSQMAKKSRVFDGDWQGDGWGISWLKNNVWKSYMSIKPMWEDGVKETLLFSSTIFLIHARSASFQQHKNNKDYNQPFVDPQHAYVFNGLLKGVSLQLPGEIGSQKIWSLVQDKLLTLPPGKALIETRDILINNTRQVQALNIGLSDKKYIYALCHYSSHADYYSLHYSKTRATAIISSEPIDGFLFTPLLKGEMVKF